MQCMVSDCQREATHVWANIGTGKKLDGSISSARCDVHEAEWRQEQRTRGTLFVGVTEREVESL